MIFTIQVLTVNGNPMRTSITFISPKLPIHLSTIIHTLALLWYRFVVLLLSCCWASVVETQFNTVVWVHRFPDSPICSRRQECRMPWLRDCSRHRDNRPSTYCWPATQSPSQLSCFNPLAPSPTVTPLSAILSAII